MTRRRNACSRAVSAVMLLSVAGCGVVEPPILDGPPTPTYAADLAACDALARQKGPARYETGVAAAAGGVLGGGLADLDGGVNVAAGVAVGALAGLVGGSVDTAEARRGILLACLKGRGHAVVG